MFRAISQIIQKVLIIIYLILLSILPFEWYKIGPYSEIFPALDLTIIYYCSTYYTIHYWHLFVIGVVIDQIYQLPTGISSVALIIGHLGLGKIGQCFLLRDYITNIAIFCIYSVSILCMRYILITINNAHHVEVGASIYFYFITTMSVYPIMHLLIESPFRLLAKKY